MAPPDNNTAGTSGKPMDMNSVQEVHLSHYANIIYKRWKVAASVVLAVMIVAYVLSKLATPLYRSEVVLQVERERSSAITVDDLMGIEPSSQQFLQTQFALIKSRGLAERVVDDLGLLNDPIFNPEGTKGKSDEELKIIKSSLKGRVQGGISVSPIEWTSLVQVSYVDSDPRVAQKVVNGIGESYIRMTIERTHDAVRQTSGYLTSQIDQLTADIEDAEKQLQRYRESKDITSLDESSNITVAKLNEISRTFTAAQSDRIQKEITWQTIGSANPESIPEVVNDSVLVQQRTQLGTLQNQYSQKLAAFKPEHPEMVSIQNQIDKTRQAIVGATQEAMTKARATARTQYESALSREKSLAKALEEQKRVTMDLNASALASSSLQSTIDSRKGLLGDLVRRLSETEVTARVRGQDGSNIVIVSRADVPGVRFNESLRRNMRNAFPLGVVLGLAAIFFLEYLDRSLKSAEDVERTTGFASLGVIPSTRVARRGYGYYTYGSSAARLRSVTDDPRSSNIDLLPHSSPRSPIAEAYRAFRTALLLSSARSPKVVVVTSTSPREGKTTTAVNLAVVIAQMGRPVLLIDGDLRKPRLHKVLGGAKSEGLVNHLAIDTPIADIIQETQVPNLFYIGSGPIPPNPSELLGSEKMSQLIEQLRELYAYVVIDSPPVLAVTDSIIVASHADGVILCVRGGATPRDLVQRTAERLRQNNVSVLGTLLNSLDLKHHGYSYAKQYYEYYEEGETSSPKSGPITRVGGGRKAL